MTRPREARAALRPRARPRADPRPRAVSPRPRPGRVLPLPDRRRLPAAAGRPRTQRNLVQIGDRRHIDAAHGERGRYLVAATFGNVRGTYAPGKVVLRPEILQAGQRALAAAYPGARFQYVFHGSSGSSERELADAVSFGVVKVNVDTDNQYAFTRAVAGHVLGHWQGVLKVDGGIGDKHGFDPRAWGSAGEAAMAGCVRQACEQLGSAGRSLRPRRRPATEPARRWSISTESRSTLDPGGVGR